MQNKNIFFTKLYNEPAKAQTQMQELNKSKTATQELGTEMF